MRFKRSLSHLNKCDHRTVTRGFFPLFCVFPFVKLCLVVCARRKGLIVHRSLRPYALRHDIFKEPYRRRRDRVRPTNDLCNLFRPWGSRFSLIIVPNYISRRHHASAKRFSILRRQINYHAKFKERRGQLLTSRYVRREKFPCVTAARRSGVRTIKA